MTPFSLNKIYLNNKKNKVDYRGINLCQQKYNKILNINTKYSIPAIKEWTNSEYVYNKTNVKLIPIADDSLNNLIKSYFNLKKAIPNRRLNSRVVKFKLLTMNKILVSKAEIKHTNNKAIITIYIYNRNEKSLKHMIKKLNTISKPRFRFVKKRWINQSSKFNAYLTAKNKFNESKLNNNKFNKYNIKKVNANWIAKNKLNTVLKINLAIFLKKNLSFSLKDTKNLKKIRHIGSPYMNKSFYINIQLINLLNKVKRFRKLFLNSLGWNKKIFSMLEYYYYNLYLLKVNKKNILRAYYYWLIYTNINKLNKWFLIGIKSLATKIYKKNTEFNIVNLKYHYHNNDIFTQTVISKLKNRRFKPLRVMKKAINSITIPEINLSIRSAFLNKRKEYLKKSSPSIIYKVNSKAIAGNYLGESLLIATKYKTIDGVRIETSGRLTSRLVAARSVHKSKLKGSMKDSESSNKTSSNKKHNTALRKGYVAPNIQYSHLISKTRNGAFGLKGWISNY